MISREESIDHIRRFNRRYVPVMRLLDKSYLNTGMSTLEIDALIEIGENEGCSARDIAELLSMDKGYLSRAIKKFEERGWIRRSPSEKDARLWLLSLTEVGRRRVDELSGEGASVVGEAFKDADDEDLAEAAEALNRVLQIMEGVDGGRSA